MLIHYLLTIVPLGLILLDPSNQMLICFFEVMLSLFLELYTSSSLCGCLLTILLSTIQTLYSHCHHSSTKYLKGLSFTCKLPLFISHGIYRFGLKEREETYSSVNIYGLRTVYMVLFVLASTLSLAFYGYFYAFCLLHIVINNDILQRVLHSVTKNGMIIIIIIY